MENLASKRTEPGICVFDLNQRICFINQTARTFWGDRLLVGIPSEVQIIYKHTMEYIEAISQGIQRNGALTKLIVKHADGNYFIRSIILPSTGNKKGYILILIEKVRTEGISLLGAQATFHLTPRECDVVQCLLSGLTNKEIAVSLNIEVNTVKEYIKNIMRKTGVTTRTGILSKLISLSTQ